MIKINELLRRQQALADFGAFVLECEDLQQILTEGCRLIADALHADLAKVLEIENGRGTALVRAGIGWNPGIVGKARIQLHERTSEAHAIRTGEPLITPDIDTEDRFELPSFLREHGVKALVNVPIFLPGRKPYGVLQVDSRKPYEFGEADVQFLRTYAMVLGPVIDRLRKARDLAQATEKYRLIVENARDYAIILSDEDDNITDWLPGAAAIFGWTADEIVGKPSALLFTPEDRLAGQPAWEIDTARREGKAPDVRWHSRKDGGLVFIDGQTTALTNSEGAVSGFMKIGQDITQRRRVDEALQTNEARLRLALDTARLTTWDWDMTTDKVEWSEEHFRIHGYDVGKVEPSYAAWASRIHPDDRQATEQALAQAREQHQFYTAEFRVVHPDGTIRWCSARGRFFHDKRGKAQRMIGVMQDISERRESEDRQRLLLAELQHRTRNLLAVVRSLADKTAAASEDLPDFKARFSDRLLALARVQNLLSRLEEGDRIVFDQLLAKELSAMDGYAGRLTLDGPQGVPLRSSTVQILALALHELATNAVKYGALGQPQAALSIVWRLESKTVDRRPWLHIDWRETDVVMTSESGAAPRSGQGRELIERALPYQLGADTTYTLRPDGVHCTISVPVSTGNRSAEPQV
jgi:PAS domain S-box-containing protein